MACRSSMAAPQRDPTVAGRRCRAARAVGEKMAFSTDSGIGSGKKPFFGLNLGKIATQLTESVMNKASFTTHGTWSTIRKASSTMCGASSTIREASCMVCKASSMMWKASSTMCRASLSMARPWSAKNEPLAETVLTKPSSFLTGKTMQRVWKLVAGTRRCGVRTAPARCSYFEAGLVAVKRGQMLPRFDNNFVR